MKIRPMIFLAMANEPAHSPRHLAELEIERNHLDDMLTSAEDCDCKSKTEVTVFRILDTFAKHRDNIKIFHFAGHASSENLWLTKEGEKQQKAYPIGLASSISSYGGIRLAFLNGCSTQGQVKAFHTAGIPAVIATTRNIRDDVARAFAEHFYRALVQGETIQEAFSKAEKDLLISYSPDELYKSRDNVNIHPPEELAHPYELRIDPNIKTVGNERLADWVKTISPNPQGAESSSNTPQKVPSDSYLLCNRSTEEKEFALCMNRLTHEKTSSSSHRPQFFFIQGPQKEEPIYLSERFKAYTLFKVLENLALRNKRIQPYLIEWPNRADFEHSNPEFPWESLRQQIKNEMGITTGQPIQAERILQHIRPFRSVDIVYIRHNIRATNWHPNMAAFITKYIKEFWNIGLNKQHPHIIIVFNVIYNEKWRLFHKWTSNAHKIKSALRNIDQQQESCTLIHHLEPVEREDVERWRDRFMWWESDLVENIYRRKRRLPMKEVSKELKQAIKRHSQAG